MGEGEGDGDGVELGVGDGEGIGVGVAVGVGVGAKTVITVGEDSTPRPAAVISALPALMPLATPVASIVTTD